MQSDILDAKLNFRQRKPVYFSDICGLIGVDICLIPAPLEPHRALATVSPQSERSHNVWSHASSHGSGNGRHGRRRFLEPGRDDEHRRLPTPTERHRPGHRRQRHPIPGSRLRASPPTCCTSTCHVSRRHHRFYQGTPTNPVRQNSSGPAYTPEGLYPLTGVHIRSCINYPSDHRLVCRTSNTSVGQGDTILTNTIAVRHRQRQQADGVRLLAEFRRSRASTCRSSKRPG